MSNLFDKYGIKLYLAIIFILALLTLIFQKIFGEGLPLVIWGVWVFFIVFCIVFNPFNILGKDG